MTTQTHSLGKSFALCEAAYLVAIVVALVAGVSVRTWHPITIALVADLAATLAVYAFSAAYSNSSFYDPYWSVAPPAILLFWIAGAPQLPTVRQIAVSAIVLWWAVRLTYNWARRWEGLSHEDWRYTDFRTQFGRNYWMIDLGGIHVFPTIQVFLGSLPLFPALRIVDQPFGIIDGLALAVGVAAVVIETVADQQLWGFLAQRKPGDILQSGLWAYSRHPNYFGEILFWWSLFLFGVAADPAWWWTGVGAVAISLMFHFASVPMIDKRSVERRPGYAELMQRVSAIVPWFRK